MQEKIEALTGVNILTDSGAYKDTYTILNEIGKVWKDMSDIDQAALLELMAGKNRANTLAAILGNMKDLEGAYESALNAEGSALKENEAYLDSIQGRIDLFNNSVQTMWMNLIDSEIIKSVVDLGTELIKLVDTLGLIPTALAVFAGFKLLTQPIGLISDLNGALKGTITLQNLANVVGQKKIATDIKLATSIALADTALVKYAITSGLVTAEQVAQMTTTELLGVAFMGLAVKIKTAAAALLTFLTTTPLGWATLAITAITGVIAAYEYSTTSHEEYIEQLEKETEALQTVQSELKNVQSELETTKDRIDELNSKESLSFVEQEELDRLKEQNAELERQEKILKERETRSQRKQVEAALNAAETDPNFKDKSEVVQQQVASYAAANGSASLGTWIGGMPYAPGQQASSTQIPEIEELGNNYEIALQNLKEAQDKYATANEELTNAVNLDDDAYAALVQKRSDALAEVTKYNDELDALFYDWETKYGDVGTYENPTEEWQKNANDFVRQYEDFVDQQRLINGDIGKSEVLDRVFSSKGTDLAREFEESFETAIDAGGDPATVIAELLASENYTPLLNDLQTKFGITSDTISGYFMQIGEGTIAPVEDIVEAVKTYSALVEEITSYNDILSQTSEIVADNTEVTEEYKEALIKLVGSEEEVNECFDENNKLVVKDAKALNNLVKATKKNKAQNIQLAKSQARLEYYELYKKMRHLTNGTKVTNEATMDYINSLYQQMGVLQRTIAKYSLLEAELLGTANAYQELADAQAADEAMDYGSKAEELVNVLAEAFNTGELGTEAARVAIEGLIPDEVIDKSKTLDEQMQQIYDYFTKGKVSQLFTIEFDDEGNIENVKMALEDVKAFTDSLIRTDSGAVFQGTWDEFTLNPAIQSLEDFAEACGVTKEVAFAYLTELEKYDIGNVLGFGGDSLLDQLMGDNFDYQLQKAIQTAAEVEKKLAEGTIKATDKEYQDAVKDLEAREEQAIEDVYAWSKQQEAIKEQKDLLIEYQKECDKALAAGEDTADIEKKIEDASGKLGKLLIDLKELDEPTEFVLNVAISEAKENIDNFKQDLDELVASGNDKAIKIKSFVDKIDTTGLDELESLGFIKGEDGVWRGSANIEGWSSLDPASKQQVLDYINMIEKEHQIDLLLGEDTPTVEEHLSDIAEVLKEISKLLQTEYGLTINTDGEVEKAEAVKDAIDDIPTSKTCTVTIKEIAQNAPSSAAVSGYRSTAAYRNDGVGYAKYANGTVHTHGSAFADGSFGAPKTETALVGELGPELLVRNGRWTTVGDNGAEFTQVKKGDIIFNHKQTKQLLENGYVTSRGKAYASGTAYASIDTWTDKVGGLHKDYSNPDVEDSTKNISDALDDAADSVNEFEETIDWIEIRMEEFDERIGMLSAQLENLTTAAEKNAKIDELIAENKKKQSDAEAGAKYYEEYAEKYLTGMNSTLVEAAKNGAIAITEFTKEQDEATVNAIQNYRDYAQKAADLHQQAEEIITEIADLAKQAFDNVVTEFENKISLNDSKLDRYEAHNSLLETDKGWASEDIYTKMQEENKAKISILEQQRNAMQAELDTGKIKKGTDAWYEAVNAIAEVDTEIVNLNTEIEDLQDSINDLNWEQFEFLITQLQAVSDEAENLLDILATKDSVDEFGNWTDEGITSLGLLAQKMEVAEKQASKYEAAIEYLNKNWEELGYTQTEYVERLEELKSGQYEAIQSYNDAKESIRDLNEARVDAIKDGIEKEIDAYSELIEKKKELLNEEKDAYDFQKSVTEQQKDIASIQRKLAALAGDNSTSARAQKAKLQAELYEAQTNLEESYYERSIDNQTNALDKELESFEKQKEAEIESWEKYLENLEVVVADSLAVVQENTSAVLATLTAMQDQYGLTLTNSLLMPWQAGEAAIQEYGAKLSISLTELAAMFGLTVDEFAAKLGLTTEQLVSNLNITVAQMAESLGLTNEQLASKLGLTVTDLNGKMDMTIQQLAAIMGITLPALAEKLGTTTAGLAGNLDMTMAQFAGRMSLTVEGLAGKLGLTTADLAKKLKMTYQDLVNPFGLSMSATIDALTALEQKYKSILDSIDAESKATVAEVNKAMDRYQETQKTPTNTDKKQNDTSDKTTNTAKKAKTEQEYYGVALAIWNGNYGWGVGKTRINNLTAKGFDANKVQRIVDQMGKDGYVRSGAWKGKYHGIKDLTPYHINKFAKGTTGVDEDQLALIDELGDELVMHAQNGKLAFLTKGSAVIPHDISENLMTLGSIDPQDMLDRNRPAVTAPHIVNNEINITMDIGEVVHIDHVDHDTLPDLTKTVRKEMDSYMSKLNGAIRSKVR